MECSYALRSINYCVGTISNPRYLGNSLVEVPFRVSLSQGAANGRLYSPYPSSRGAKAAVSCVKTAEGSAAAAISKDGSVHKSKENTSSPLSTFSTGFEPQRALEEIVPLSLQNGSTPAIALGLLINTSLETSVANACMPLPTPLPHNVVVEHLNTADGAVEVDGNKIDASVRTANSVSIEELFRGNNQENAEKDEDPKLSESKVPLLVPETENVSKIEISEKSDRVMASVEECPTCLEEYNDDNPKIITKCEHHFHLAYILEWMERSDTCPVCNKKMTFSSLTNQ